MTTGAGDREWFSAPPARTLDGSEVFDTTDATVLDFWRFAMSDLRMNNVRGYLAEFLVARALGATGSRIEWDAFDILTPEGIKVEVKSSAYMQVWDQHRPSRITFTGLTGRTWTPQDGESAQATYNADVYVFAVQTAPDHDSYDILAIDQWTFYVLSRRAVEALGQKSIGLPTLAELTPPIEFSALGDAVRTATSTSPDGSTRSSNPELAP